MRPLCQCPAGGEGLAKARLPTIDRERHAVMGAASAIATAAAHWFTYLRGSIGAQLQAALAATAKADDIAARVDKILAGLDFDGYEAFIDIARAELQQLFVDGAAQGAAQLGGSLAVALDQVNERAVEFARDRSAEMVGMKWIDGQLVPNPRAEFQITEGTREMLRAMVTDVMTEGESNDFLADALSDIYGFSAERAETIARTETARCDVQGSLEGYRALGVSRKQWLTAPDCCDLCQDLADEVVGIDEQFPNGGGAGAPLHPNCRCDVLPVIDEEPPDEGKTMKGCTMKLIWNGAARESFRASFPITKTEKLDDGRLMVEGIATNEALDSDGEVVDYSAAKAAFSNWAGNIREQHDVKKAVGRAVEVVTDDASKSITVKAFISAGAPDTQAKLLDGTLGSFSIAGSVAKRQSEPVTKADGSVVQAVRVFVSRISETSVVDVGANPESGISLVKALGDDLVWADEADSEGGETDVSKAAEVLAAYDALTKAIGAAGCPEGAHMAEWVGEMAKAGRRFSTKTTAALKAAHEACKAADKALSDLGYEKPGDEEGEGEDEAGKAAKADDLAKAAKANADAVTEIAKAAGLELSEPSAEALAKAAMTALLDLRKKHADLLASPAAPKGVTKALPVGKEADRDPDAKNEPPPVTKADGAVDDVATLVKAAQTRPIRLA
jgi:SPP1 gp7 family putative phage head morphogenesis protein